MKRDSFYALLLLTLFLCASCDENAQTAEDSLKYPRISLTRPLGSPCYPGDTASVTRKHHPLYPTGFLGNHAQVDYQRTLTRPLLDKDNRPSNSGFVEYDNEIRGFAKFDTEGVLHVRAYDDVYGEDYAGWGVKLPIHPTSTPVFISLSRPSFGDGNTFQINEVCWIPNGADKGTIIYSSAYADQSPVIKYREVFSPDDLIQRKGGNYYKEKQIEQILDECIKDRDPSGTRTIIRYAEDSLKSQPGAISGASGAKVSSESFHRREWIKLLSVKLGLAIGTPEYTEIAWKFKEMIDAAVAEKHYCFICLQANEWIALYDFVNQVALGNDQQIPHIDAKENVYRGAMSTFEVLNGKFPRGERKPSDYWGFWRGIRALKQSDYALMKKEIEAWLSFRNKGEFGKEFGFEEGAALRLLEKFP